MNYVFKSVFQQNEPKIEPLRAEPAPTSGKRPMQSEIPLALLSGVAGGVGAVIIV